MPKVRRPVRWQATARIGVQSRRNAADFWHRTLGIAARLAVSALALQLVFGLVFAWGAVAPYALAEHWSPVLVGAVFSGTPIGYGLGTVVGGRLADRLPPRPLCFAGIGLLALGFAIAFLVPSGVTFVAFYAFLALGLGGGITLTGALGAVTQGFPGRAGLLGGMLTAAYASGTVIQVPIVTYLIPHLGWIGAVRAVGTAFTVVAIASALAMPSLPKPRRPAEAGEHAPLGRLVLRPLIWTGIAAEVCGTPLGAYTFVNIAGYAHRHGFGLALAGAALTTTAIANALSRILSGVASDRIGVNAALLMILLGDLVTVALLLVSPSPLTLLPAAFAAGWALGGGAGILGRMAAESAPDAPHSAFGLLFTGFAGGAFLGPLFGAALAGTSDKGFLLTAAPVLAGLAIVAWRSRLRSVPEALA